jgi:hypothetical protein
MKYIYAGTLFKGLRVFVRHSESINPLKNVIVKPQVIKNLDVPRATKILWTNLLCLTMARFKDLTLFSLSTKKQIKYAEDKQRLIISNFASEIALGVHC